MSWSLGTLTLSKNTWQKDDLPLMRSIGRASMPGEAMSTTSRLMPFCLEALGSVRTSMYIQSDLSP